MKNQLYISFFGLGLSVISELKKIISVQYSLYHDIHWTNIADKKLQMLFINDDYIDAMHLKNLDLTKLSVLKLDKNENLAGQVLNDILYLPLKASEHLLVWLEKNILASKKITATPVQPETIKPPHILSTLNTPTLSHTLISKAFKKISLDYSNNTKFIIRNKNTNIAIFDKNSKEFFLNNETQIDHWDAFEIVPADLNEIIIFKNKYKAVDLNSGIWSFVWMYLAEDTPNYLQAYQLLHWPQPSSAQNRSELLKIAAYFSHGSTVSFIQTQTNFSKKIIERFIFSCEIAQMIETIPVSRAAISSETPPQQESNSVIRGFLNKLRSKLGI